MRPLCSALALLGAVASAAWAQDFPWFDVGSCRSAGAKAVERGVTVEVTDVASGGAVAKAEPELEPLISGGAAKGDASNGAAVRAKGGSPSTDAGAQGSSASGAGADAGAQGNAAAGEDAGTSDEGYAIAPPMTEDLTRSHAGAGPSTSAPAAAAAPNAGTEEGGYAVAPPMTGDLARAGPDIGSGTAAAAEKDEAAGTGARKQVGGTNSVNGYLDSRSQFARSRVNGLIPTNDLPQLQELVEVNVQLRHDYAQRGFVYGDLSAFALGAGNFRGLAPDGEEIVVPAHDVAALHPFVSLNELYLSQDIGPTLNLLAGKKRVVWGSGFAFNPTDLINPPKDPSDPNFQRAGAWMAKGELNLGTVALTALAAPMVTSDFNGLPAGLWRFPKYSPLDDGQGHYLFAGRLYALVANSDLNLMAFFSNRYNDEFEHKLRYGISFSRYFFTDYELHAEALLQQGSTRLYPNGQCLTNSVDTFNCARAGTPLLEESRLDDRALTGKIIVGTRRQFDDESLLSIEYYYQSDGYTPQQFQQFVNLLEANKQSRTITNVPQGAVGNVTSGQVSPTGIPQKFTFDPLRRHYLFINYSKPKIFEDWTASVFVLADLEDLSTLWSPTLSWSTTEWLTLTAQGFIPAPGPRALATQSAGGGYFGEYTLIPNLYRVLFEARFFY